METPIWDFLKEYNDNKTVRFHMPGHKGVDFLGCEHLDLTEVRGADSLYEADGIIARSEENAAGLFGSGRTVFSTEGSSQCIRAMLYLAINNRAMGTPPVIVAARNVHKAFIYAAALLDFHVVWLWPEGENKSLCSCPISPETLEQTLSALPDPPAAVYLTSPDYLGNTADISALAKIAHRHGTMLVVDNAHGAYLHFLSPARHPMDQGADLCCDSAHKTLPVLTGGAYLHFGRHTPKSLQDQAKGAMALFGSTSPSYLTMASLDHCNRYLAQGYRERLAQTVERLEQTRVRLRENGWQVEQTDPLRLTITANCALSGTDVADILRRNGMECEYADPDSLVLMMTPENSPEDFHRLVAALGKTSAHPKVQEALPLARGEQIMPVRRALFSAHELVPAGESLGRICGAPTVACPPAIPIAVSGEQIGREAIRIFDYYGVREVDVVR